MGFEWQEQQAVVDVFDAIDESFVLEERAVLHDEDEDELEDEVLLGCVITRLQVCLPRSEELKTYKFHWNVKLVHPLALSCRAFSAL